MSKDINRREFLDAVNKCSWGLLGHELRNKFGIEKAPPIPDVLREYIAQLVKDNPHKAAKQTYDIRMEQGVGYATQHNRFTEATKNRGKIVVSYMHQHRLKPEQLDPQRRRLYAVTQFGEQAIPAFIDPRQYLLTPEQALTSPMYAGYLASVSPKNLGDEFLVFGIDNAHDVKNSIRFLGKHLITDCYSLEDWLDRIKVPCNYRNWVNSPWIADAPDETMRLFPVGASGDPEMVREHRPGVAMLSKDIYLSVVQSHLNHQVWEGDADANLPMR